MQRKRGKAYNALNVASLARWIILSAFIAAIGLIYVYLTVQLNHLGDRKKALETELVAARLQNVDLTTQIATLKSPVALQRRLKEGYLKMIPIAEHNIVRLNLPSGIPAENAVQPIVNQRANR